MRLGKSGSALEERVYYHLAWGGRRLTDANHRDPSDMNVTALTDTSGSVIERYAYDPYGKVTFLEGSTGGQTEWNVRASQASIVANEVLFAGYRFDNETGLYHVRNRPYHPLLGRWLTRDPLGYVDGPSLYEYVRGAPVSAGDPLGRCTSDVVNSDRSSPDGTIDPLDLLNIQDFWDLREVTCTYNTGSDEYVPTTPLDLLVGRRTGVRLRIENYRKNGQLGTLTIPYVLKWPLWLALGGPDWALASLPGATCEESPEEFVPYEDQPEADAAVAPLMVTADESLRQAREAAASVTAINLTEKGLLLLPGGQAGYHLSRGEFLEAGTAYVIDVAGTAGPGLLGKGLGKLSPGLARAGQGFLSRTRGTAVGEIADWAVPAMLKGYRIGSGALNTPLGKAIGSGGSGFFLPGVPTNPWSAGGKALGTLVGFPGTREWNDQLWEYLDSEFAR